MGCTIGQIGQRCIVATITDKCSDSSFQPPCYFRERSNSGEWHGRADNRFLHAREKFRCSTLITLVILLFGAVPTTDLSIPSICGFIRQKEITSSKIILSRMSVHILVWIQLR